MFTPKSKRKRVNNENPQPSKVSGVILVSGEKVCSQWCIGTRFSKSYFCRTNEIEKINIVANN